MNRHNFRYLTIFSVTTILLTAIFFTDDTLAQTLPSAADQLQALNTNGNLGKAQDPRDIVSTLIRFSLGFLGIGFVAYMMYGGYLLFSSRGEREFVEEGKKTLLRAVVGLIVIMLAYSITIAATMILSGNSGRDFNGINIREDQTPYYNPDPFNENLQPPSAYDCVPQANGNCVIQF